MSAVWKVGLEDNIKEESVSGDVDWIHLTQHGVQWRFYVNTIVSRRIHCKTGNVLTSRATVIFSRSILLHGILRSEISHKYMFYNSMDDGFLSDVLKIPCFS
jgi:hypothetical protein